MNILSRLVGKTSSKLRNSASESENKTSTDVIVGGLLHQQIRYDRSPSIELEFSEDAPGARLKSLWQSWNLSDPSTEAAGSSQCLEVFLNEFCLVYERVLENYRGEYVLRSLFEPRKERDFRRPSDAGVPRLEACPRSVWDTKGHKAELVVQLCVSLIELIILGSDDAASSDSDETNQSAPRQSIGRLNSGLFRVFGRKSPASSESSGSKGPTQAVSSILSRISSETQDETNKGLTVSQRFKKVFSLGNSSDLMADNKSDDDGNAVRFRSIFDRSAKSSSDMDDEKRDRNQLLLVLQSLSVVSGFFHNRQIIVHKLGKQFSTVFLKVFDLLIHRLDGIMEYWAQVDCESGSIGDSKSRDDDDASYVVIDSAGNNAASTSTSTTTNEATMNSISKETMFIFSCLLSCVQFLARSNPSVDAWGICTSTPSLPTLPLRMSYYDGLFASAKDVCSASSGFSEEFLDSKHDNGLQGDVCKILSQIPAVEASVQADCDHDEWCDTLVDCDVIITLSSLSRKLFQITRRLSTIVLLMQVKKHSRAARFCVQEIVQCWLSSIVLQMECLNTTGIFCVSNPQKGRPQWLLSDGPQMLDNIMAMNDLCLSSSKSMNLFDSVLSESQLKKIYLPVLFHRGMLGLHVMKWILFRASRSSGLEADGNDNDVSDLHKIRHQTSESVGLFICWCVKNIPLIKFPEKPHPVHKISSCSSKFSVAGLQKFPSSITQGIWKHDLWPWVFSDIETNPDSSPDTIGRFERSERDDAMRMTEGAKMNDDDSDNEISGDLTADKGQMFEFGSESDSNAESSASSALSNRPLCLTDSSPSTLQEVRDAFKNCCEYPISKPLAGTNSNLLPLLTETFCMLHETGVAVNDQSCRRDDRDDIFMGAVYYSLTSIVNRERNVEEDSLRKRVIGLLSSIDVEGYVSPWYVVGEEGMCWNSLFGLLLNMLVYGCDMSNDVSKRCEWERQVSYDVGETLVKKPGSLSRKPIAADAMRILTRGVINGFCKSKSFAFGDSEIKCPIWQVSLVQLIWKSLIARDVETSLLLRETEVWFLMFSKLMMLNKTDNHPRLAQSSSSAQKDPINKLHMKLTKETVGSCHIDDIGQWSSRMTKDYIYPSAEKMIRLKSKDDVSQRMEIIKMFSPAVFLNDTGVLMEFDSLCPCHSGEKAQMECVSNYADPVYGWQCLRDGIMQIWTISMDSLSKKSAMVLQEGQSVELPVLLYSLSSDPKDVAVIQICRWLSQAIFSDDKHKYAEFLSGNMKQILFGVLTELVVSQTRALPLNRRCLCAEICLSIEQEEIQRPFLYFARFEVLYLMCKMAYDSELFGAMTPSVWPPKISIETSERFIFFDIVIRCCGERTSVSHAIKMYLIERCASDPLSAFQVMRPHEVIEPITEVSLKGNRTRTNTASSIGGLVRGFSQKDASAEPIIARQEHAPLLPVSHLFHSCIIDMILDARFRAIGIMIIRSMLIRCAEVSSILADSLKNREEIKADSIDYGRDRTAQTLNELQRLSCFLTLDNRFDLVAAETVSSDVCNSLCELLVNALRIPAWCDGATLADKLLSMMTAMIRRPERTSSFISLAYVASSAVHAEERNFGNFVRSDASVTNGLRQSSASLRAASKSLQFAFYRSDAFVAIASFLRRLTSSSSAGASLPSNISEMLTVPLDARWWSSRARRILARRCVALLTALIIENDTVKSNLMSNLRIGLANTTASIHKMPAETVKQDRPKPRKKDDVDRDKTREKSATIDSMTTISEFGDDDLQSSIIIETPSPDVSSIASTTQTPTMSGKKKAKTSKTLMGTSPLKRQVTPSCSCGPPLGPGSKHFYDHSQKHAGMIDILHTTTALEPSLSVQSFMLLLDMLMEGPSLNFKALTRLKLLTVAACNEKRRPKMKNPDVIPLIFSMLPYCSSRLQVCVMNTFRHLLSGSARLVNQSVCCHMNPPLFDLCVSNFEYLSESAQDPTCQLLSLLGQHTVSVAQLKRLFRLMQTHGSETRHAYNWKIIAALRDMILVRDGPRKYFLLEGVQSGLRLPASPSWPAQRAYSFATWFCIDLLKTSSDDDREDEDDAKSAEVACDYYYPTLLNLREHEKGGASLVVYFEPRPKCPGWYVPVVECVRNEGHPIQKKVFKMFALKHNVWYFMGISHIISTFRTHSEFSMFIDSPSTFHHRWIQSGDDFSFDTSRTDRFDTATSEAALTSKMNIDCGLEANLGLVAKFDVTFPRFGPLNCGMIGDICGSLAHGTNGKYEAGEGSSLMGKHTTFRGQLGCAYFFDDALSDNQLRGIFQLGPNYCYSFESSSIDQRDLAILKPAAEYSRAKEALPTPLSDQLKPASEKPATDFNFSGEGRKNSGSDSGSGTITPSVSVASFSTIMEQSPRSAVLFAQLSSATRVSYAVASDDASRLALDSAVTSHIMLAYNASVCQGPLVMDNTPERNYIRWSGSSFGIGDSLISWMGSSSTSTSQYEHQLQSSFAESVALQSLEKVARNICPIVGQMHAIKLVGTFACITGDIRDSLDALGGVKVLFPLFAQFDLPLALPDGRLDYSAERMLLVRVLDLLAGLLRDTTENQRLLKRNQGIALLGYLLNQISCEHFSEGALDAIVRLIRSVSWSPLAQQDVILNVLGNFRVWIYSPTLVHFRVIEMLREYCLSHPAAFREFFGVQRIIDAITILYYYDSSHVTALTQQSDTKSRNSMPIRPFSDEDGNIENDIMEFKPSESSGGSESWVNRYMNQKICHPQKGVMIGERPSMQAIRQIREALWDMVLIMISAEDPNPVYALPLSQFEEMQTSENVMSPQNVEVMDSFGTFHMPTSAQGPQQLQSPKKDISSKSNEKMSSRQASSTVTAVGGTNAEATCLNVKFAVVVEDIRPIVSYVVSTKSNIGKHEGLILLMKLLQDPRNPLSYSAASTIAACDGVRLLASFFCHPSPGVRIPSFVLFTRLITIATLAPSLPPVYVRNKLFWSGPWCIGKKLTAFDSVLGTRMRRHVSNGNGEWIVIETTQYLRVLETDEENPEVVSQPSASVLEPGFAFSLPQVTKSAADDGTQGVEKPVQQQPAAESGSVHKPKTLKFLRPSNIPLSSPIEVSPTMAATTVDPVDYSAGVAEGSDRSVFFRYIGLPLESLHEFLLASQSELVSAMDMEPLSSADNKGKQCKLMADIFRNLLLLLPSEQFATHLLDLDPQLRSLLRPSGISETSYIPEKSSVNPSALPGRSVTLSEDDIAEGAPRTLSLDRSSLVFDQYRMSTDRLSSASKDLGMISQKEKDFSSEADMLFCVSAALPPLFRTLSSDFLSSSLRLSFIVSVRALMAVQCNCEALLTIPRWQYFVTELVASCRRRIKEMGKKPSSTPRNKKNLTGTVLSQEFALHEMSVTEIARLQKRIERERAVLDGCVRIMCDGILHAVRHGSPLASIWVWHPDELWSKFEIPKSPKDVLKSIIIGQTRRLGADILRETMSTVRWFGENGDLRSVENGLEILQQMVNTLRREVESIAFRLPGSTSGSHQTPIQTSSIEHRLGLSSLKINLWLLAAVILEFLAVPPAQRGDNVSPTASVAVASTGNVLATNYFSVEASQPVSSQHETQIGMAGNTEAAILEAIESVTGSTKLRCGSDDAATYSRLDDASSFNHSYCSPGSFMVGDVDEDDDVEADDDLKDIIEISKDEKTGAFRKMLVNDRILIDGTLVSLPIDYKNSMWRLVDSLLELLNPMDNTAFMEDDLAFDVSASIFQKQLAKFTAQSAASSQMDGDADASDVLTDVRADALNKPMSVPTRKQVSLFSVILGNKSTPLGCAGAMPWIFVRLLLNILVKAGINEKSMRTVSSDSSDTFSARSRSSRNSKNLSNSSESEAPLAPIYVHAIDRLVRLFNLMDEVKFAQFDFEVVHVVCKLTRIMLHSSFSSDSDWVRSVTQFLVIILVHYLGFVNRWFSKRSPSQPPAIDASSTPTTKTPIKGKAEESATPGRLLQLFQKFRSKASDSEQQPDLADCGQVECQLRQIMNSFFVVDSKLGRCKFSTRCVILRMLRVSLSCPELTWAEWIDISSPVLNEAIKMEKSLLQSRLSDMGILRHSHAFGNQLVSSLNNDLTFSKRLSVSERQLRCWILQLEGRRVRESVKLVEASDKRCAYRWERVLEQLANERGAWGFGRTSENAKSSGESGTRKPDLDNEALSDILWSMDSKTDNEGRRMKLVRNPSGTRHVTASRLARGDMISTSSAQNLAEMNSANPDGTMKPAGPQSLWKDLKKYRMLVTPQRHANRPTRNQSVMPNNVEAQTAAGANDADENASDESGDEAVDAGQNEQKSERSEKDKQVTEGLRKGILFNRSCQYITPFMAAPGNLTISNGMIQFVLSDIDVVTLTKQGRHYNGNLEWMWAVSPPQYAAWSVSDLVDFQFRSYMLSHVAVEMSFSSRLSAFVVFSSAKEGRELYRVLRSIRPPLQAQLVGNRPHVRAANTMSIVDPKLSLSDAWKLRKLSNFEYLMSLNILAGRTYNDIAQYPIFPWVLREYDTQSLDLRNSNVFRDFAWPMGAQLEDSRMRALEKYQMQEDFFNESKRMGDECDPPFNHGSHYSCSGFIIWYLMRMEPFTSYHVCLTDGKIDKADRLFDSISSAYHGCITNPSDVKELVPEFFYCPDFLVNVNKVDLGSTQSGKKLGDVKLPLWASDEFDFIQKHRDALESEYVSAHLHEWIDLLFGYKQRPPYLRDGNIACAESCNAFYHCVYEGAVDLNRMKELDRILYDSTIKQIENFGQNPSQLFKTPHPARCTFDQADCIWMIASALPGAGTVSYDQKDWDKPSGMMCFTPYEISTSSIIFIAEMSTRERLVTVDAQRIIGCHLWQTQNPDVVPPFKIRTDSTALSQSRRLMEKKSNTTVKDKRTTVSFATQRLALYHGISSSLSSNEYSNARTNASELKGSSNQATSQGLDGDAGNRDSPEGQTGDGSWFGFLSQPERRADTTESGRQRTDKRKTTGQSSVDPYDVLGGHLLAALADKSLVFSCGHWDDSFKITNMETGSLVQSVSRHHDIVTCLTLAFDFNKYWLITGSCDCTVMVWEVSLTNVSPVSKTPMHILYGHDDAVLCVACAPQMDLVVSTGADGTIILYNLRAGEYIRTITPPKVAPCLLSSNSEKGDFATQMERWQSASCVGAIVKDERVRDSDQADVMRELDVETCDNVSKLDGSSNSFRNSLDWVGISKIGCIVAYSQDTRSFFSFTVNGKFLAHAYTIERVHSSVFSNDGRVLLVGGDFRVIRFLWTRTLRLAKDGPRHGLPVVVTGQEGAGTCGPFGSSIRSMVLSTSEHHLIVGLDSGELRIMALDSEYLRERLQKKLMEIGIL